MNGEERLLSVPHKDIPENESWRADYQLQKVIQCGRNNEPSYDVRLPPG
jgi:hypothetical protein